MLKFPPRNLQNLQAIKLNPVLLQPCIVGYMSTDASRNYHSDISQLKFINEIPKDRISWDLNQNVEQAVKRTTDDNTEKIDLLLKFLLDQGGRLNLEPYTFISYRRTLIKVMCSSINITDPVCIRASLYNNNIYLHYIVPDKEVWRIQNCSDQEKKFMAWGYKFEQYLSSDDPTLSPNIQKPVVENEEFSLYYCSELGGHKLFYGAQIDGLLATKDTKPKPKSSDVTENIQYLECHDYLELKTNKEFQNPRQEITFKRFKMLRCWCQCYLANLKGLLVGFRDDHGIVRRLQWFDTGAIPEYCKHEWDYHHTINFLDYFLTFVKKAFYNHSSKHGSDPISLDFFIQPDVNRTVKIVQGVVHPQDTLLPDWYINATSKRANS